MVMEASWNSTIEHVELFLSFQFLMNLTDWIFVVVALISELFPLSYMERFQQQANAMWKFPAEKQIKTHPQKFCGCHSNSV